MKILLYVVLCVLWVGGCVTAPAPANNLSKILPVSQVPWEKLNPARGDKSPQAGTVWGDRKGSQETAFLAKFVDGFSSPPHVHNVSYRGIVLSGEVHNDDPRAAKMWMPKLSYWTQPAGEAHITAARGRENIAFIEIDRGPYLVKPAKMETDNGERALNVHRKNTMWMPSGKVWIAPLWKNDRGQVSGSMLKFQKQTRIQSESARLVVVDGTVKVPQAKLGPSASVSLEPGSVMTVRPGALQVQCATPKGCVLYIKSNHRFVAL